MKISDEDKKYESSWKRISSSNFHSDQLEFWYYKNYNNYVSIRKIEDFRSTYSLTSLFLFWVLLLISELWLESTAGQLAKDWWEFFGILFTAVVLLPPILTVCTWLLLDYFFACFMPHEQRIKVWNKYGISCPKCFKLAEPINKSRNNYTCHNPDCDMPDFANVAHNVSRAY